jgi:RimJ/RimL family protein N-acetyltransferase
MPFYEATLMGRWVQLEPLHEAHRDALRVAGDDDRIWEHGVTRARGPGFVTWFDTAMAQRQAGQRIPFAVRRRSDGEVIGSTSFLEPVTAHRRVEIGATWYVPREWGTMVNPECKYMLLRHAFEVMGMNRVSLVTDVRNERSQAAIAKLGAVREGILRSHMVVQDGRVRDSVLFSIVAPEWPTVREKLLSRLADQ